MKWTSKDNNRARRGFTLAELLMTVAIIGILAAFGFVAVVQHQKSLKLTEMDNAAREIFVAAQDHLSESKSSGDWGKIYNKYKDGTTDSVYTLYLGGYFDQTSDKTKTVTDSTDKSKHDWRTITVTPEAVSDLRKNTALGVMLPVGATDETLLSGGCYVVEYDAMTATVYGVFYTDKTQAGVDETDIAEIDNMNGGRNDGNSNRKQFQKSVSGTSYTYAIGYYGGASATESTISKTSVKFTVTPPTLTLLNEERLLLVVSDRNKSNLLYQSTKQKNAKYTYTLTLTVHDSDGHQMDIGDSVPSYPTGDGKTVYILDSVADKDQAHFAKLFHSADGTGLTPGSNIYVTADATVTWNDNTDSTASASAQATSETHNSLFADGSGSDAGALIENGRHLQNLSTSVSGVTDAYAKAHLKKDIAWNTEGGSKNTPASFINGLKDEEKKYFITTTTSTLDFRSIYNTSLTSFDGTNGTTSYTLSSFTVKEDTANESDSVDAGLFSKAAADFTVQDLSVDTFTVTSAASGNAGAILGTYQPGTETSKLTLQNVTVQNSRVGKEITKDSSAAANAASGMLVGSTTDGILNLNGCSVKGTIEAYGTKAGGLVGLENANSVTLQNCNVGEKEETGKITISATEAAGGLIGRHTSGSLLISSSNVKAREVDVSAFSEQGAAGGLIGAAKMPKPKENSTDMITALNITESSVEADNITVHAGRHAGGAIGQYNLSNVELNDAKQKASITLDTVTVKADIRLSIESAGSTTSQDTYCAGGMIGEMKDAITATLNTCKVNAPTVSISATDISGDKGKDNSHVTASGGLIGQIYFSGNCKSSNGSHGSQPLNIQIGDSDITASTSASMTAKTNNNWMDGAAGGYLGSIVLNSGNTTVPVIRISDADITTPEISVSSTDISSDGNGNENSAGGLIGSVYAADSYATSENNSAIQIAGTNLTVNGNKNTAFNVSAADDAGGLIGMADKHTDFSVTSSKLEVSNSAAAVTSTTGNAGGLVGSCVQDGSDNNLNDTVRGYSISTKTLNISAGKNAGGLIGLFSNNGHLALNVSDSTIQAENLTVAGTNETGGIAGSLQNKKKDQAVSSRFSNCNVNGGATGLVHSTDSNAGGFVGSALNSSFTDCYTTLLVKDKGYAAGGFGGSLDNVTVNSCYAGGRTKDGVYTKDGKAISSGSVVLTYAQNVSGPVVGGFAGITDGTTSIRNSYSTCSVYSSGSSQNDCAGGFVGSISSNKDELTTINNCYCTGLVTTENSKAAAGLFAGKAGQTFTGSNNYCLKDLEGNAENIDGNNAANTTLAAAVTHDDEAIAVAETSRATAHPYDSSDSNKSDGKYPFRTLKQTSDSSSISEHNADWPTQFKEEDGNLQTLDRDVAILYYEEVQHHDGTKEFYYHGYKMNFVESSAGQTEDNLKTKNKLQEIQTKDTLTSRYSADMAIINDSDSKVNDGNGEEYVIESGYVLIFDDHSTTDQSKGYVSDDPNRSNAHLYVNTGAGSAVDLFANGNGNDNIVAFNDKRYENNTKSLAEELGYKDTKLYYIKPSAMTQWTGDALESAFLLQFSSDTSNIAAQFYINPYLSDSVSPTQTTIQTGGTYNIDLRSAWQMKQLFDSSTTGGKYLHNAGQSVNVYQTMDISFDNSKIYFSEMGEPVYYNSPTVDSMTGNYYGAKYTQAGEKIKLTTRVHTLKYLTQPLFKELTDHAKGNDGQSTPAQLAFLNIQELRSNIVDTNCGKIHDIVIDNSTVSDEQPVIKNVIAQENANEAGAQIYNCQIKNVRTSGGCVAGKNEGSIINVAISDCEIGGNGIADETSNSNNCQITSCTITDSHITENGICGDMQTTVSNCSISNSKIDANGIADKISGGNLSNTNLTNITIGGAGLSSQNSGTIDSCNLVNAHIVKAGAVNTNTGTIKNCHLFADASLYPNPKSPYYKCADSSNGYMLTTVGLIYNENSTTSVYTEPDNNDYYSAGFVQINKDNGNIVGCSFTGSVYGDKKTAGFFGESKGLEACYSNAYVFCGDKEGAIGAGFGIKKTDGGDIDYCHCTGKIKGGDSTIQAGFLYDFSGNNYTYVNNCYSAIWFMNHNKSDDVFCCNSWVSGASNAFNKDNKITNAVLGVNDLFVSKYAEVKTLSVDELTGSTDQTWGSAADAAHSHPYYVTLTKDENKQPSEIYDPFPMPSYDGSVMSSYGDWYVTGTELQEPSVIITDNGSVVNGKTYRIDELGTTIQLTATYYPDNSAVTTWNSSDTGVATVDSRGNVKVLASGKATITASTEDGAVVAAVYIKVKVKVEVNWAGFTNNIINISDYNDIKYQYSGETIKPGSLVKDAYGGIVLVYKEIYWINLYGKKTINDFLSDSNANGCAKSVSDVTVVQMPEDDDPAIMVSPGDVILTQEGKYYVCISAVTITSNYSDFQNTSVWKALE